MTLQSQAHWNGVYKTKASSEVSWYQGHPTRSLNLIGATGIRPNDAIIDVGGGTSRLVDELLFAGYSDVTVLDVSTEALNQVRERLGQAGERLTVVTEDVTVFKPTRRYCLWHDRALFHFLVEREDRARYLDTLRRALLPHGHLILATFGPQGPQRCSDLPIARYDCESLAAEVGSEFHLIEWSLDIHHTPRGTEQQFLYCRFTRSGD
jgi:hypothetical protein